MATKKKSSFASTIKTGLLVLLAILTIVYVKYLWNYYSGTPEVEASKTKTSTSTPAATTVAREKFRVVDQCDTGTKENPCKMDVGSDQFIDTGHKPALVQFNGRTEWYLLSGRRDDPIPAEKFNSGTAKFATPDGAQSIHVQIKERE